MGKSRRTSTKSKNGSRKKHERKRNTSIILTKGTKVKNRCGTTKCRTKNGESWLGYHKRKSKREAPECSIFRCTNKAKVGAHVDIQNKKGVNIIQLCKPCNASSKTKYRRVNAGTCAVPVPKKDTKGPKLCYS